MGWIQIEAEAQALLRGAGVAFPLPAYSEFMPAPWIGLKPYGPSRAHASATHGASDDLGLDVTEYEQAHDLEPGLPVLAERILHELERLSHGKPHALSQALLHGNPAWPAALADAAAAGRLSEEAIVTLLPLALSRTQDDKGNQRWTLFGHSHLGPAAAFWRSYNDGDEARFDRLLAWCGEAPASVLIDPEGPGGGPGEGAPLPRFAQQRLLGARPLAQARALLTFRPFAHLPPEVQQAVLARTLRLLPSPASLVFFEHPFYKALSAQLPRARQIALQQLFPRVQGGCTLRIPQSGWLDERDPAEYAAHKHHAHHHRHRHALTPHVARSHRWQKHQRDAPPDGDGAYTDRVSVALFSCAPDDLGLYGKPMARNVQLWDDDYTCLLDGPAADRAQVERAARRVDRGGQFGYRFHYPPMRAGARELFWHLPLVARLEPAMDKPALFTGAERPLGFVSAERGGSDALLLSPRLLARPGHDEAARLFARDAGHRRHTTSNNARALLEFRELLGAPLPPSLARRLVHCAKEQTLEQWLGLLPAAASDSAGGERLAALLRATLGAPLEPGPGITFAATATRAFEEGVWRSIAGLAEGEFKQKDNADTVLANKGRTGGKVADRVAQERLERRDLEALGDHLHERYRALFKAHGMEGRAQVVDHRFRWETECDLSWSEGWAKNQRGEATERNVVCVIPGRNRGEALIMGDHYDTAYMEDAYEKGRGGDGLRAAASGADDNHSATTALLRAAEVLLPLSREGRLERDVWLIHLTGEEFPSDCLGARALGRALVERNLRFVTESGAPLDVSQVRVAGAFVLDMVGHNHDHDRDVFQIAPGEGAGSARLALRVHAANERWNRAVPGWNKAADRAGHGRAHRMPDGSKPPPPFAHLALAGEVRTEWQPRSALYNTDGQIFSDLGVPVVLLMENYDLNRTGYHDTEDTMANIDLDYCAALTAIAIEAVVECACAMAL
jgi:hypothetical protein